MTQVWAAEKSHCEFHGHWKRDVSWDPSQIVTNYPLDQNRTEYIRVAYQIERGEFVQYAEGRNEKHVYRCRLRLSDPPFYGRCGSQRVFYGCEG
jgi:hypothetical protein